MVTIALRATAGVPDLTTNHLTYNGRALDRRASMFDALRSRFRGIPLDIVGPAPVRHARVFLELQRLQDSTGAGAAPEVRSPTDERTDHGEHDRIAHLT
jgi:hypothetical protein